MPKVGRGVAGPSEVELPTEIRDEPRNGHR